MHPRLSLWKRPVLHWWRRGCVRDEQSVYVNVAQVLQIEWDHALCILFGIECNMHSGCLFSSLEKCEGIRIERRRRPFDASVQLIQGHLQWEVQTEEMTIFRRQYCDPKSPPQCKWIRVIELLLFEWIPNQQMALRNMPHPTSTGRYIPDYDRCLLVITVYNMLRLMYDS